MFLVVNPSGTRHLLFNNFSEVVEAIKNDGKYDTTYDVILLDPGNPGKYNINMSLMTEPISGGTYVSGEVILDKKNTYFFPLFTANARTSEHEKIPLKFLYSSSLVKGGKYIEMSDVDQGNFTELYIDALFQPSSMRDAHKNSFC